MQVQSKPTKTSTDSLVKSLVISRLNYYNRLLCGLPIDLVTKPRLVQNKATELITPKKNRDHIMRVLCKLHCLAIDVRINFKVLYVMYKALHELLAQCIYENCNE